MVVVAVAIAMAVAVAAATAASKRMSGEGGRTRYRGYASMRIGIEEQEAKREREIPRQKKTHKERGAGFINVGVSRLSGERRRQHVVCPRSLHDQDSQWCT